MDGRCGRSRVGEESLKALPFCPLLDIAFGWISPQCSAVWWMLRFSPASSYCRHLPWDVCVCMCVSDGKCASMCGQLRREILRWWWSIEGCPSNPFQQILDTRNHVVISLTLLTPLLLVDSSTSKCHITQVHMHPWTPEWCLVWINLMVWVCAITSHCPWKQGS